MADPLISAPRWNVRRAIPVLHRTLYMTVRSDSLIEKMKGRFHECLHCAVYSETRGLRVNSFAEFRSAGCVPESVVPRVDCPTVRSSAQLCSCVAERGVFVDGGSL